MKRHKFTSKWRNAEGNEVEIVERPSAPWFRALTIHGEDSRQAFRFSLLGDGSLYFGDAYTVLHHDIMQWRGPDDVLPILVGVVLRADGGPWRVALVQYFMEAIGEARRFQHVKKLLGQIVGWKIACETLGSDPFAAPPWGEEY